MSTRIVKIQQHTFNENHFLQYALEPYSILAWEVINE